MSCAYCEGIDEVSCHVCMDDRENLGNFADGVNAVYVTTEGDYSDFCIDRLFTSKEAAVERLRQARIIGNPCRMEIRPLDQPEKEVARQFWMSYIHIKDGRIERYDEKHDHFGWADPSSRGEKQDISYISHIPRTGCPTPERVWVTSYVDHDHADKLAAELRQEILRKCAEMGIIIPGSRKD